MVLSVRCLMRGIVSGPARSFIGTTAARTGTPLGTSRVFLTALDAPVFGTPLDAAFLTSRAARVFGTALDLDAVFLDPRAAPACSGA